MKIKCLAWIDVLNIVACAVVLLLHCTDGSNARFSGTLSLGWYYWLDSTQILPLACGCIFHDLRLAHIQTSILTDNKNFGWMGGW